MGKGIIGFVLCCLLAGPALADWSYKDGRAGQGLRLGGGAVIYLGVICHTESAGNEISVSLTIADKLLKDGEVPVRVGFDGEPGEAQIWRAVARSGALVYSSVFVPKERVLELAKALRNHKNVRLEITKDANFEFPLERSGSAIGSALRACQQS